MTLAEQRHFAYVAFMATPAPAVPVEPKFDTPAPPYALRSSPGSTSDAWVAELAYLALLHPPTRIGRYGHLFDPAGTHAVP